MCWGEVPITRRVALRRVPSELELTAELLRLIEEEKSLSSQRSRLHEQLDNGTPNELLLKREEKVSAERRAVHSRIDLIKAQLAIVRGEPA